MYATSTASTTTSGSARTERCVRVVRLVRPRRPAHAFGFSVRGGQEHSTGFFISKVEFNSEAQLQGLKVGDQLVSVNGYRVDDAVHGELMHYLASQSRLKIKVRHVGMLPCKDKIHEPVSWQWVGARDSPRSEASASPPAARARPDLRLSLLVPPRAKLGCGICKGPEWKPGIFVQFVRENGIAREAGLRPGDQILSCNGYDFSNITFNEAISVMKAVGRLELLVRVGAGTELVSPESSGYNSSASSAAGERSPAPPAPPATLRRRLASVAEEAADRADRLNMNRLKRRTWDSLDFEWKTDVNSSDAPSDIEPDYDSPSIPNNPHTYDKKHSIHNKTKNDFITSPSNRTIINLTEDGATIQCSYDKKTVSANHTSLEDDKKTIVVEVHHTSNTLCPKTHCNYQSPVKNETNSDSASVTSSLTSAIAEEIQRRKLNKKSQQETKVPPVPLKKPPAPKSVENEQKKQHDALMDEFKKVHRKMFAGLEQEEETPKHDESNGADNLDRQQTLPLRKVENNSSDYGAKPQLPPSREATDHPPPPPPMPVSSPHKIEDVKKLDNYSTLPKTNGIVHNGTNITNGSLKRTPTPDYNNKTNFTTQYNLKQIKDEKAELESLESYKLKSPLNVLPKPPSNYFVRAPNGTATMKKHGRPVSVTIGEYPSVGVGRKEPSKLDFLNGDKTDGAQIGEDVPISNRLQSELALTLSRSNLRKKTDTTKSVLVKNVIKDMNNSNGDSDDSLDKNFHARYGNNILPLPPSITIPKVDADR